MKKVLSVISVFVFIITMFTSCSNKEANIEDYEWTLRMAMNRDEEGLVVAVDEKSEEYPEAKVVEVTLTAKNGELVIYDKTNNKTYEGAYEEMYVTDNSQDYKIIIKGKEGYANSSKTVYSDGRSEPTLPMTVGGYDLYFYVKSN